MIDFIYLSDIGIRVCMRVGRGNLPGNYEIVINGE